jgi:hypothetical protein
MKYLVVIGSAQHGLAFVGPFATEAEGEHYIIDWKAKHDKATPIGVVELHAPENLNAGHNLPG